MTQEAAVEIVRLRREIERRVAEMCEMRTEIERLRKDLAIWRRNGGDDLLRAENQKLRDVLVWTDQNCPGKCAGVIRTALEGKCDR